MRTTILFALLFLFYTVTVPAQSSILPEQTAEALARKIAGQGVTILNAKLRCPMQANAIFTITNSDIGLDSGIVLTTGRALSQGSFYGINGNSSDLASFSNGVPGDADLDLLAGKKTVDGCALEFDVVPVGDNVSFNYVFSSEEYINSVCGPYNDAFAFFISGPGITGQENMALVPGSTIPVTINTINNGIPGPIGNISNCTMAGAGAPFKEYYIDNTDGKTITYQGFTKILKATHTVTPCTSYHLKIVIADAGNPQYDSGVFLEAGSLQTDNYSIKALVVSPTSSHPFCVKGCLPGHFTIKRSQKNAKPQTIKLITGGNAVKGVDYDTVPDSIVIPANENSVDVTINGLPTPLQGAKFLQVSTLSPYLCNGVHTITDSAVIVIYDTIHAAIITPDMNICRLDSIQIQVLGDEILHYSWSPAFGLSNANIKEPIATPSSNTTYQLTASLPGSACIPKTALLNFNIRLTPTVGTNADTTVCYNTPFQLHPAIDSNVNYSYHWSGPGGFTSSLASPIINADPQPSGMYKILVVNDTNNCKATATTNVMANTPAPPEVTTPNIICINNTPEPLTAKGEHLLWYVSGIGTQEEPPTPPTGQIDVSTYYVTQTINDCQSLKSKIDVDVRKCCDGPINIPSAFTPNGDGHNDRFYPMEAYGYTVRNMIIINRWGQVVFTGKEGSSWDGSLGNTIAEMGSYFYLIYFDCILGGTEVRKGDVTLIR